MDTADAILAAGFDPARWADLPIRLTEHWPGTAVLLQGADSRSKNQIGVVQHGLRTDLMASYEQHYFELNPWIDF